MPGNHGGALVDPECTGQSRLDAISRTKDEATLNIGETPPA